jgi:cytochrome c oxidase subunit 4
MSQHVVPSKLYYTIFGALMVLTAVTVAASFVDLGALNIIVALAIAGFKASLVVLFFMHVKWSGPLTKVFIVTAIGFVALLLGFTLADYVSRAWLPGGQAW